MIMKANKQIGFIYKNNESIDKILKDGDVVFERGFLRERTTTTLPITFGGVGKDLKDYRVYGNTYQNSTSGKNLFIAPQTITSDQRNLATYTKINDNSFSLNYTQSNQNSRSPYARIDFDVTKFKPNTRYTISERNLIIGDTFSRSGALRTYINGVNGNPSYTDSLTFTTPSQIDSLGIYFYLGFLNTIVGTSTITFSEIQLEEGSQATEFEPYTNGASPNPDYPQEIISCGDRTKNLFDKENYNYIPAYLSTSNIITNSEGATTFYIKCEPNTTYTVSKTKLFTNDRFCLFDTANIPQINDSALSYVGTRSGEDTSTSLTITTSNNANYLCVFVQASPSRPNTTRNNLAETIQIEKNSTATSYEPYGYKIPVNVRSENLFDLEYELEKQYSLNGTETSKHYSLIDNAIVCSSSNNTGGTRFFNKLVLNAGTYTFSCDISQTNNSTQNVRQRIRNFDNLTDIVSSATINVSSGKYSVSFTIEETTTIGIMVKPNQDSDGTISMTKVQLVKGSTAPDKYIPYYNETTNIYLDEPLRKIDGYSDYIDFVNRKLYRKIEEHIFTGATDDGYSVNSDNTNTLAININPDKKQQPAIKTTENPKIYSDKLNFISSITDVEHIYLTNATIIDVGYRSAIRIYINKSRLDGYSSTMTNAEKIELVKTWLQSNPLTTNYITYTPTEETITLPNIPTINGNNTLNIETEITPSQVYIKYKSNT